ncbi:MAG: hypothetical protein ACI9R3_005663 [Verrucomicrobiales bacterium]
MGEKMKFPDNRYCDPLVPELSQTSISLFKLTEEEQISLKGIIAEVTRKVREFEQANASTITDDDGKTVIHIAPYDSGGSSVPWQFHKEMQIEMASVIGEDRTQFVSESLTGSTYHRRANEAVELSFEQREGSTYMVHKTLADGNGGSTLTIPVDHPSEEIVARYGYLLGIDSAEELGQAISSALSNTPES